MDDDAEFLQRRPPGAPASHHPSRRPPPPPPNKVPGFFGLPLELRQHIYAFLLDSDRVSPPAAPYLGDHKTNTGEIKYPTRYKAWRWPTTHWTHRDFRNELIDVARERLESRQAKAELDIMASGYVFFPTWLHLPPDLPGDHPFDLSVSLRIFSSEAFRSNDGWPRQPGSGFRSLLRLLNQLIHEGPSFGQTKELLAGASKWRIHALRVNVSFHDTYTPSTWPDTIHQILRMLKALATSGLAHNVIHSIHADCTYTRPDTAEGPITHSHSWPVASKPNDVAVQQWRQMGFLNAHQRTLADDYRPPWDPSSGGPSRRPQKRISPLERRDSPVGIIAPATKNPQQDDYGLITPPTPRGDVVVVGSGKRRSTPQPPSAGLLDDYSGVMTPGMSGLLDDYSAVMTPVTGGAGQEDDYSGVL